MKGVGVRVANAVGVEESVVGVGVALGGIGDRVETNMGGERISDGVEETVKAGCVTGAGA